MIIQIHSINDIKGDNYLVYKHSLTCPISAAANRKVETYSQKNPDVPIYMCVVQGNEDLKMEIAKKYDIKHESPQVIIVKNNQVIGFEQHRGVQLLDNFFE
jgi:bacillithiol system protein YtxJ